MEKNRKLVWDTTEVSGRFVYKIYVRLYCYDFSLLEKMDFIALSPMENQLNWSTASSLTFVIAETWWIWPNLLYVHKYIFENYFALSKTNLRCHRNGAPRKFIGKTRVHMGSKLLFVFLLPVFTISDSRNLKKSLILILRHLGASFYENKRHGTNHSSTK